MNTGILFFVCSLASIFGISSALYSISFMRPCKDMSPECLKKSMQAALPALANGIPELRIDALDPYIIKKLKFKLPGAINIDFTDGYAKGLKNCVVDYARYEEGTLECQLHCNLTVKGKYKSSGHLLLFPIEGHGESIVKCKNVRIHYIIKLGSKVRSDGHSHLYIQSVNYDHSYDGRVSYSMTKLFRGNPEISEAVLKFMNNNWKMIAEEFGTPMVDYAVKSVMKNLRRLLKALSIDELKKL